MKSISTHEGHLGTVIKLVPGPLRSNWKQGYRVRIDGISWIICNASAIGEDVTLTLKPVPPRTRGISDQRPPAAVDESSGYMAPEVVDNPEPKPEVDPIAELELKSSDEIKAILAELGIKL